MKKIPYLKHYWFLFPLTWLSLVVTICLSITFKTNPKKEDKIALFLGCYGYSDGLKYRLLKYVDKNILDVEINLALEESDTYNRVFEATKERMDAFIVSGKRLQTDAFKRAAASFLTLESEALSASLNIDDPNIVSLLDRPIGLKIFNGLTEKGLASSDIFYHKKGLIGEDYYLLLGTESVHTGILGHKKSSALLKLLKGVIHENK